MTKMFLNGRVNLLCGDGREMMKTLADASVDSIVTDPPYGLGFMGKKWDTPGALVERKAATENKWDHVGGNHNPSNSSDAARTARVEGQKFGRWCEEWAREAFRVLKPGGHLLAFSGTRTYHRLACAIEDAGFEIRDQIGFASDSGGPIDRFLASLNDEQRSAFVELTDRAPGMAAWTYGSGFPKSLDVSKAIDKAAGAEREIVGVARGKGGENINKLSRVSGGDAVDAKGVGAYGQGAKQIDIDIPITAPATNAAREWQGWGTALKPAWEPICVARKPLIGTVAENVQKHGTGALNIDGCRVESDGGAPRIGEASQERRYTDRGSTNFAAMPGPRGGDPLGRWPANIILDGSDEVVECFPDAPGQIADASASAPSRRTQNCYGAMKRGNGRDGEASGDRRYTDNGGTSFAALPGQRRGDIGSAARFFYQVKMEGGEWHGEARTRASSRDRASDVDGSISLQSEAVVSALKRAVDTSAVGLTLNSASYRAPSTTVTASECEQIAMLVTEMTQNIARRCSLGQPPENITQSDNLASIVATRKPTGIIAITISPSKSNGSAEPVTFDIIETKSELGASGSPKKRLHYTSKAGSDDRIASKHPTVKPVDLMQYLVRLVTPKGGLVLDPFAGTGTTGEAAWREGMRAVLIEREPEYQDDIARRMDLVLQPTKRAAVAKTKNKIDDHGPLFGGMEKTQ